MQGIDGQESKTRDNTDRESPSEIQPVYAITGILSALEEIMWLNSHL